MKPLPTPIAELLAEHTQLAHALARASQAPVQREQILLLLEADLRNYRLLYGLEQAGFLTEYFHTHLEKVVLPLIGFTAERLLHDNRVVSFYFQLLDEAMETPLKDFLQELPQIAAEMYGELVFFRTELED